MKKTIKSEKGALIIEASISLSVFMFAVFTVLLYYRVALAQARIGSALNAAAKEISQYAYVYELTGLNEKQAKISSKGQKAGSVLSENLSEINDLYGAFEGLSNSAGDILSSSEKSESFLYWLLNQGIDKGKGLVVGSASKGLMKKHFGSGHDAADSYLRWLGVVDGINGLHMGKSVFMQDGTEDNIILVVQYKVAYMRLFNKELTMDFELCAKTRAWVGSD